MFESEEERREREDHRKVLRRSEYAEVFLNIFSDLSRVIPVDLVAAEAHKQTQDFLTHLDEKHPLPPA